MANILHFPSRAGLSGRPGGNAMFGIDWNDQTLWLNVTNLALGVVTLAAVLVAVVAVARELVARRREAREAAGLDEEMRAMFDSPHALSVPGLGLTMADGGVPVKPADVEDTKSKDNSRK
jgi:hypothetical protein